MNKELEEKLKQKMDEIKAIVSEYLKPFFGDIEIKHFEIDDDIDTDENGNKIRKIELYIDTNKGYLQLKE